MSGWPDGGVGFAPRLGAFALDWLVIFVVTGPLSLILGPAGGPIGVVGAIAYTLFCWHRWGATPGKIAFSAKIVDARSGGRPSLGRLAVRYLAYLASALPFCLGFAWIAVDRRKQAWHDKIAGTRVVYQDD